MEHDFWLEKWSSGQIGFHEPDFHPMLERYWDDMGFAPGERVFVPLCGKSHDMRWLAARGHEVVGVELSEIACRDFFGDNDIAHRERDDGVFRVFEAPGYRLLCGDFFALGHAQLGPVAAAWDRASLVALPETTRQTYARHLATLMPAGTTTLLVTLQYAPDLISPPPFHIADHEADALFRADFDVKRLGDAPSVVKGEPCTETAFRLVRR